MDNIDQKVSISIRHLREQVNLLNRLQQHVNALIDPELAQYIKVANLKKQTLILMADNASIATHVKLIVPDLLEGIKARLHDPRITAIQCKVKKPKEDPLVNKPKRTAHLSKSATDHIASVASGIKHPRLKAALEKLSEDG